MKITLEFPTIQIAFAANLVELRSKCLQDALLSTIASLDISNIDSQLYDFVAKRDLQRLARMGIRGEILFAIPEILKFNPFLLAYYRLLLGYSQKSFYSSSTGASMFKSMEQDGKITKKQNDNLSSLCMALNINASYLLDNLTKNLITTNFFDQLSLLTLGAQLRDGINVMRGCEAISKIYNIIIDITKPFILRSNQKCIEVINKSKRMVYILFSQDPDISIKEKLSEDIYRLLITIEIKGGKDYSNIHNRIGEAEKSHQKAKMMAILNIGQY